MLGPISCGIVIVYLLIAAASERTKDIMEMD